MELLHLLKFLILLGCGLLVPGWLLGRALDTRGGLAGALLGSAALLMNLVLLFDALGVRLDAPRISVALALVCAGLVAIDRLRARPPAAGIFPPGRTAWRGQSWGWLLLPAAIGLLAITLRAGFEPLSGWDCAFRWDFLAREMIRTGTLHFYPAVTTGDFLHYGWPDGIAPLISSLYAWSYLSLGGMEKWATTPVVLAQALVVFHLVGKLAALRSGAVAGALAAALLALSPLFLWGVAMGQENGMIALSAVAMFWFIEQGRVTPRAGWMVWAGLAAGTGALAREYGLLLIPLGALALAWGRVPRRGWLAFAAAAAAVALPWYLRNWIKTGHPLYCYDLGNLFPTNPVLMDFMRAVIASNSITKQPAVAIPLLAKLLGLLAAVPLVLGLITGIFRWRLHGPWLVTVLAFLGFWLWAAAQTAGGYIYSMRVLTPAIALAAVLGGMGLARFAAGQRGWILAGLLALGAVEAGERSLFLPLDAQHSWWRDSVFAWRQFGEQGASWRASSNWAAMVNAAEGRRILVCDPNEHAVLVENGGKVLPYFTPDVRFLFAPEMRLEEGMARLRAAGYRFVLITRNNTMLDLQLGAHPFFVALAATTPAASTKRYFVYDLYLTAQRQPDPAAPVHVP